MGYIKNNYKINRLLKKPNFTDNSAKVASTSMLIGAEFTFSNNTREKQQKIRKKSIDK
jgi:hypothetical protein